VDGGITAMKLESFLWFLAGWVWSRIYYFAKVKVLAWTRKQADEARRERTLNK
jgi:hypothetical protein